MAMVQIDKRRQAVVPKVVANASRRLVRAWAKWREAWIGQAREMERLLSRDRPSNDFAYRRAVDAMRLAEVQLRIAENVLTNAVVISMRG